MCLIEFAAGVVLGVLLGMVLGFWILNRLFFMAKRKVVIDELPKSSFHNHKCETCPTEWECRRRKCRRGERMVDMAWWEDRSKVRGVMEIERVMVAIQADIAVAEIRHDDAEVARLFDLKIAAAKQKNDLLK